jgi:uncharacterized protein (TIGR02145 family)
MERIKPIPVLACAVILLLLSGKTSDGNSPDKTVSDVAQTQTKTTQTTSKSTQTKTKSSSTTSKSKSTTSTSTQKSATKPQPDAKSKDEGTIKIGNQRWAVANLNVNTFRNGDTIPEARTWQEWTAAGEAGKPAWCYYNNDPATGKKYGKLYNWFAVNDPRGLAPAGWALPTDADWVDLASGLGGHEVAGNKMKSSGGWNEGYNGTNDAGFTGLPGGYRTENGSFLNVGNIGTWWSTTENKGSNAIDFYLSQKPGVGKSATPKMRGESVRCVRK